MGNMILISCLLIYIQIIFAQVPDVSQRPDDIQRIDSERNYNPNLSNKSLLDMSFHDNNLNSNINPYNYNPYNPNNNPYNMNNNGPYPYSSDNNPYNPNNPYGFNNDPYGFNNNPFDQNYQNYNPNYFYNTYDPFYQRNMFYGSQDFLRCPEYWLRFQQSCYRFIQSPHKPLNDARSICRAFVLDSPEGSDLVSVSSLEEHGFLLHTLNWLDPQHRSWYTGAFQQTPNYWVNPDGSQLVNMENAFIELESYGRDYLAYNFSRNSLRWGFQPVRGDEYLLFICEANIMSLQRLVTEERSYTYGIEVDNPERIPRGPFFIKQPIEVTFDTFKRKLYNDAALSCLAGGYPTPTYKWFKEEYQNDRLVAMEIDPLRNGRFTISGGTLIIHDPQQETDFATYHCKASNRYGTIISESVQLNFGFIKEFVLKRSPESGDQNWGKSIYCDPPNHFPAVKYQWSRDYFPNFVEEDKRVFVSRDGALYFSALETIDRANYSCSVQSDFSDSGRNGPFFPLKVNPHSNYQQLKFPNNFPKAFPDAPTAGKEARLECVAFGYPVPNYNWTRKGAPLPKRAYFTSYNRVLLIPNIQVEDQGEYSCRAYNDRSSISNSLILNIQAEPNFTIPLRDKHVDKRGELVWTCEAFGIPDVNYTWWRNGHQLVMGYLRPEDHGRIKIIDNILTISYVDERDAGMYQCRASNSLKARYSSAQLRILAFKPSFKKRPLESEMYAVDQGNVTIRCNPEAAPRPQFNWKKDGVVIGPGGHRKFLENGNLVISPVSRDDGGLYTCTASNELGMDESSGRLIILRGPRLVGTLQPRIVVHVGNSFSLECSAVTDENLDVAYIWVHNGIVIRDIDVKNSYSRIHMDEGFLRVNNATFYDDGEYECVVKSAVGAISSKSEVIVEGPPGPPGGVQVYSILRDQFTLQWTDGATHGSPIVSYSISGRTGWNQTWVNISHGIYANPINRFNGRMEAVVEAPLTPWSTYEFRVHAWNNHGIGPPSAPSPRHSTPPDRPYVAPSNIGGGGGKVGDLTITWTPLRSDQQNADGIYYKVYWKRKDEEAEFQQLELKKYGNTGKAVVSIKEEYYYTQYVVRVQAINDVGPGPISEDVTIYSAESMPLISPSLVYAHRFNSTAMNITWVPINETRETIKGKLIGYRIKYWTSAEEQSIYYLSRSNNSWALIVGLIPDTTYNVKAMVFNSAGEGPESERAVQRTFRKAPQKPPSSVKVKAIDPSTVRVKWRYVSPEQDEEPLVGYKIRVWESDQDISTANDTFVPLRQTLEGYVTNLQPGKTYKLRVLAFSNGGDGKMSSPAITFQILGEPGTAHRAQYGRYRYNSSNEIKPYLMLMILILSVVQYFSS